MIDLFSKIVGVEEIVSSWKIVGPGDPEEPIYFK